MVSLTVRLILAVLLGISFVLDLIFDDVFLAHSAKLSKAVQEWGGDNLEKTGMILSSAFSYFSFPMVYFYFIYAKHQLLALYFTFLLGSTLLVTYCLKMLFYKGRPYVVEESVKGSVCDPGMPSGHTVVAIICYYMVYHIIVREIWPNKKILRWVTGSICVVIATLIMVSRITLGDHSYNQVIFGMLIALNVLANSDFQAFCNFIMWLPQHRKLVILPIEFGFLCLMGITIYVNHTYRENYEFWTHIHKNPKCRNTFVLGAAYGLPMLSIFVGAFLYYPLDRSVPSEYAHSEVDSIKKLILRTLVHFGMAIPTLALYYVSAIIYKSDLDIVPLSFIVALVVWVASNYLAFAMVRLSKLTFEWLGLAAARDYLDASRREEVEAKQELISVESKWAYPVENSPLTKDLNS